ncbi:uncharacterized protein LOC131428515 [Malaya genurostris]|uniref:uncharacterized protein LOC131428515 n=1 Tax=Malaya genurostris TaxID=325434 RepID=UPI0026F3C60F|nr:uncharacterized protein LOC131428515 [Malaya genurostris]
MIRWQNYLFSTAKYICLMRRFSITNVCLKDVKTVVKEVDPYCKIRIKCNYNLNIVPYDLLECPDSNMLKMIINNNILEPSIDCTGNQVEIIDNSSGSPESCVLEIPIKADLEIDNLGDTTLSDLYSDQIRVRSVGNITTKNLRSSLIHLQSNRGNISCKGTTLAQSTQISACGKGNILLNKLQGDEVNAETELGDISVDSSYSNNSSFKTQQGNLMLKNIHKHCCVSTEGTGRLVMTGFYGTLEATVSSQEVDLQLSEIVGQSHVIAKSARELTLSVSDTVCDSSEIVVNCKQLAIDSNFHANQNSKLNKPGTICFGDVTTENKLQIEAGEYVKLRKMSWADTLGLHTRIE